MAARSLCYGCLAQRMMMIIRQRPVVSTYKNSLPYSTSSKQSKYVLDRVRTHDYENYLVCLLSPKQYRQVSYCYVFIVDIVISNLNLHLQYRSKQLYKFYHWQNGSVVECLPRIRKSAVQVSTTASCCGGELFTYIQLLLLILASCY